MDDEEDFELLQGRVDNIASGLDLLLRRHNEMDDRFDRLLEGISEVKNFTNDDKPSDNADHHTDNESADIYDEVPESEYRIKAEVRDVNYHQFKNRYSDEEGRFCIEALVAGPDEIRQELGSRGESSPNLEESTSAKISNNEKRSIHCVRIQSPALLILLCQSCNTPWAKKSHVTFFRPFASFITSLEKIKITLQSLQKRFSNLVPKTLDAVEAMGVGSDDERYIQDDIGRQGVQFIDIPSDEGLIQDTNENIQKRLLGRHTTLLELRCYVDFVEKRILPQLQRYDDPEEPEAKTVQYEDLWYLFRPGDLIYVPKFLDEAGLDSPTQGVYRVLCRWKPDISAQPQWSTKVKGTASKRRKVFKLKFYYIDVRAEAESYGAYFRSLEIERFHSSTLVTSLPAYPLRYHPQYTSIAETQTSHGQRFVEAIKTKHMAYRGWTLTREPASILNHTRHPEYVDSDIIIDFKETALSRPELRPYVREREPLSITSNWGYDTVPIIRWFDQKRTKQVSKIIEQVQESDGIDQTIHNDALEKDPWMRVRKSPKFEREDFMLLPRRLLAYVLRDRKFCPVDVRYIRKLETSTDSPFESLKINETHLRIIQSVVSSHFQTKELKGFPEYDSMMDQDLIRGKGRGVVMLLHGAPGVGKTATAEAIALEYKKPLFAITCGDLGFTPRKVEKSLNEIFRLANLWDCILLLDEADVFLSQREKTDLQRNALVSVFLRILEYYNGILFLTTNRVGTLDEAFKSRVHLSLHYPALSRHQTREIVHMNLSRLQKIEEQRAKATGRKQLVIYAEKICNFAVEHWDRHDAKNGAGRWNGRQIRNAVQTAACMAWYDKSTDRTPGTEDLPPILGVSQFEVVEKTMSLFDGYLTKTRGVDDSEMSHMRSERYDNFSNIHLAQTQAVPPQDFSPLASRSTYVPYRQSTPQPQTGWPQNTQGSPYNHLHNISASQATSYGHMQPGGVGGNSPSLSQESSNLSASYRHHQINTAQSAFSGMGSNPSLHFPLGVAYSGDQPTGAPHVSVPQGPDTGIRPPGFQSNNADFSQSQSMSRQTKS